MENEHVLGGLVRKRAEIASQVEHAKESLAKLMAVLGAIDGTIRLFDPGANVDAIKPRKSRAPPRWPIKGYGIRTAFSILREAKTPMSASEIAARVLEANGVIDADSQTLRLVANTIRVTLRKKEGNGVIGYDGYPRRWTL